MSNPQKVYQLVHTLSYGDAISGEVLALERCFRELGIESEVYAINVHPKLKGRAKHYSEMTDQPGAEVVLHYSLGSPLNRLYRELKHSKRSLIYHNLTPPKWFQGINQRIVEDIEQGIAELPELCRISDRLIADSNFNAGELRQLGFEAIVLPLPVDPGRWDLPGNEGIAQLVRSDRRVHLLHVGRLAPNKCIEDIIRVFYFLHHYVNRQSRLWLVGIDTDTELYSFALKRLTHELQLEGAVNFVGCMADSELKSLYQEASVYLCMSEHEGFCLPLIEAMNFGLPVIAYASSAVPETVGQGGVLVSQKRPAEIAELVQEIAVNEDLRSSLKAAGHKRVAELSYAVFVGRVKDIFLRPEAQASIQC